MKPLTPPKYFVGLDFRGTLLAWGSTSLGDEAIGSPGSIVRGLRVLRASPLAPKAMRGFLMCRLGPHPKLAGKSHSLALVESTRLLLFHHLRVIRLMGTFVL